MEKSVITHITGSGQWEGNYGVMYTIVVQFENGEEVEANSKSQTPPYAVGDTVWYEVTKETQYGKKAKVTKQDPDQSFQKSFNSEGGGNQSSDVQKRIDACWSIGQAITILGSVPEGISVAKWLEDVGDVSDLLMTLRNSKL